MLQAEGATAVAAAAAAGAGVSTMVLPTTDELVARICALPTPQAQERALNECVAEDYKKVWCGVDWNGIDRNTHFM